MTHPPEIYASRRGFSLRKQWRWRVRAANGKIIGVSSESYSNRADLEHALDLMREALNVAP